MSYCRLVYYHPIHYYHYPLLPLHHLAMQNPKQPLRLSWLHSRTRLADCTSPQLPVVAVNYIAIKALESDAQGGSEWPIEAKKISGSQGNTKPDQGSARSYTNIAIPIAIKSDIKLQCGLSLTAADLAGAIGGTPLGVGVSAGSIEGDGIEAPGTYGGLDAGAAGALETGCTKLLPGA